MLDKPVNLTGNTTSTEESYVLDQREAAGNVTAGHGSSSIRIDILGPHSSIKCLTSAQTVLMRYIVRIYNSILYLSVLNPEHGPNCTMQSTRWRRRWIFAFSNRLGWFSSTVVRNS